MARTPVQRGKTGSRSLNKLLGAPVLNAAPLEEVEAVAASVVLTLATNPTADDTMTIGAVVYTFVASGATGNQINIGGDLDATKVNVRAKLLLSVVVQPAASWATNNLTITAIAVGTGGNSLASTETFTAGGNVFSAVTLTGGVTAVSSTIAAALKPQQFGFHGGYIYYTPDGVNLYRVQLTAV